MGNGIPKLIERLTPEACRTPETLADAYRAFDADYDAHMFDKTRPYPGVPGAAGPAGRGGGADGGVLQQGRRAGPAGWWPTTLTPACLLWCGGALPGVPKKPAPQGTLALMGAIGAQAASTLYVGDSNVDVCTGKNVGLRCCGVLWGFRTEDELREAGADYLAADAAALEQVILAGG